MKKKLFTLMTLLLCLCSTAWATDFVDTYGNFGTLATGGTYYGLGISNVTFGDNTSNSSGIAISASKTGTFTVSVPNGFTIKSVQFTDNGKASSITCDDAPTTTLSRNSSTKVNTYTASSNKTSVVFTIVSSSSQTKLTNLIVTVTSDISDDYELITPSGSASSTNIPFTSSLGDNKLVTGLTTLTTNSKAGSSGSGNIKLDGNGAGFNLQTSRAIKAVYCVWYQRAPIADTDFGGFTYVSATECGSALGTYSYPSNKWTAPNANTKAVALKRCTGSTAYLSAIHIFYYDDVAAQDITWANGGHGTAPTEPTIGSIITLPQMDAVEGYTHTGWTANKTVKVGGEDKVAGTVLAIGSQVTLTDATTFTGVWKGASSLSVGSSEVEVAIAGTSQIVPSNAKGTVSYLSADETVATVTSTGLITAVAGGKTTITVSDEGDETTAAGSATVTILVPYSNPSAATSYVLNKDTYAFSNTLDTKYYFTNGFTIDVTGGSAEFQDGSLAKSKKYSHARSYTINVPSNVTVTYAVITARNNYINENSNPASNWGTVFGESYSSIQLPWANETPAEKDFVIETPSAGGTLAFQPGGNQWNAIINLNTDTYLPKHTVSYVAGDGTGTMAGTEVREGTSFTLPIQGTIAAPAGKYFTGWNDGTKNYVPGNSYTMSTSDVTFTAQWATSESANHYHYSYKDATRYNGTTYTDPTGTAATRDGGTHELTNDNLCSSLGGITSVSFASAKYDGKKDDLSYMSSYLKIEKSGTAKVTITIADGYAGTLKIKAGGYSNNPSLAVSNSTKLAGTVGGVATIEDNYNTLIYMLPAGTHEITCTSQNMYITEMDLVTTSSTSATVQSYGWATYIPAYDVQFADGDAYVVTDINTSTGATTVAPVTQVPANTPVLLKGEGTKNIAIINTTPAAPSTNLMTICNGANGSKIPYVLAKNGTSAGFKKWTGLINTINGRAVMWLDSEIASSREFFFLDGETTGINALDNLTNSPFDNNAPMYNLAGQKVGKNYKGIVIVNGKKVLKK